MAGRERWRSTSKRVLVAIPCLRPRSTRLWVGAERWAGQGKSLAVRQKRPAALLKPGIAGPPAPTAEQITPAVRPPRPAVHPPGSIVGPPGPAGGPPGVAVQPPRAASRPPGVAEEPPGSADQPPGSFVESPRAAGGPPAPADERPGAADEQFPPASLPPGAADQPPGPADELGRFSPEPVRPESPPPAPAHLPRLCLRDRTAFHQFGGTSSFLEPSRGIGLYAGEQGLDAARVFQRADCTTVARTVKLAVFSFMTTALSYA